MKKFAAIIAAAALALTGYAATTPIATQAWVMKQLAAFSVRPEDAAVKTNATGTVTYYSKAFIDGLPQCTAVSFTVGSVRRGFRTTWNTSAPTFLDLMFSKAWAAYPDHVTGTITIHVDSGAWYELDAAGNQFAHPFNLGDGMDLTAEIEMPDMPDGRHTCNIGDDCNCDGAGKTLDDVTYPEDLETWTAKKTTAELGPWEKWIDKDNLPADVVVKERRGEKNYYLTDMDGILLNLDNLQLSAAWAAAVSSAMTEINDYINQAREAYAAAFVCPNENPQHLPFVSGGIEETDDGFIIITKCPRCGERNTREHKHHFEDCGTCTAGDGCNRKCTGCNGLHVKTAATSSECAKCGCTVCTDCTWHPTDDINDHAGWEPCGEDAEEDNDALEAHGGHCRCQCRAFGHRARTEHDYQPESGEQRYEDYTEAEHFKVLGKCSRCGQPKKQLEEHDFPEDPTMYTYRSEEYCKWVYRCKSNGCEHDKIEDEHAHDWDDKGAVWLNHSEDVCRKRTQCKNCRGWKTDDTHGHERDTSNECACKNGCGYKFDHNWGADPCGNQACSYCRKYKEEGEHEHKGWTELDDKQHRCACEKTTADHTFTEWIKTGADPNVIHYARTCTACQRLEGKDETCGHTWGEWTEIGRGGGVITFEATCTECGATKTRTEPEPTPSTCDLEKDEHYAAPGDECGCLCGKYGKNGLASVDRSLHKWADTVNGDGIQVCVCKCGQFHLRREPTSYLLNARRACAAICAYCKEKSGSGSGVGKAEDTEHTPCTVQDARCGCLCGTLTANNTDLEQFHIQKPGTCRCFGSDGNGGAWHFPCARSDCENICQYLVDGKQHAASTKKEKTTLTVADANLHTKTKGARCGCECGTYTGANYSQWAGVNFHNTQPYNCGCYCKHGSETQVPNFHKKRVDTDCDCACGSQLISHVAPNPPQCRCQGKCHNPRHFPVVSDGKCPGVCHGACQESRDPSLMHKHAPEGSTRCGCQCNEISVTEFDSMSFHVPRGTPSCWCAGHHYHTHEPKDGCYNLCAFCNKVPSADRKSTRNADIDDHTFDAQKCVCECEEEHRSHSYKRVSSTKVGEHACEFCGNTITEYRDLYRCKRCGDEKDGNHEEGHDSLCGRDPGGDDDANTSYCEKHDIWYQGDKCPECDNETSGGGGGEQGGNSSNQSGDPDSIL